MKVLDDNQIHDTVWDHLSNKYRHRSNEVWVLSSEVPQNLDIGKMKMSARGDFWGATKNWYHILYNNLEKPMLKFWTLEFTLEKMIK